LKYQVTAKLLNQVKLSNYLFEPSPNYSPNYKHREIVILMNIVKCGKRLNRYALL